MFSSCRPNNSDPFQHALLDYRFSFDHLLDSRDSLPSLLDEKNQKNALVRKNILEFLSRCVKTSGTYGTCGELTVQYAEDLAKLACKKLNDPDAATRKAANAVLLTLLGRKEESITKVVTNVTSSLQTTNPRAYKSLKLASTEGTSAASRPRTAPASTSTKANTKPSSSKTKANKPSTKMDAGLSKPSFAPRSVEESFDEKSLPSLEDAIETLSGLAISKWGDDIEDAGVLAGLQCEFSFIAAIPPTSSKDTQYLIFLLCLRLKRNSTKLEGEDELIESAQVFL